MRSVKHLSLVGLALGLGAGPALVASIAPAGAQAGVKEQAQIVSFAFEPAERSVPLGTTITWTNNSDRPHTVTDRGGTFDTNPIAPGTRGEVTFSAPGVYHYFCRINPSKMNGIITVTGDTAQASVNRVEAIDPAAQFTGERLRFVPNELTVKAGTTVQFANVGAKPHSLTADDGSFDTGIVTPGAEAGRFAGTNASITLKAPGTFKFHCEVHPQAMTGTLTVTGTTPPGPGPAPPSDAARQASVDTVDFEFKPGQASVAPGGEVTWKNSGAAQHTATFDDVSLDTGNIAPGSSAKLTAPDKPGSYSYKCKIHPGKMRGVLVVVGQNQADPAQLATARATGPPAVAAGATGPGGGVSTLALATGVVGAFLGGFGISAFVRPRRAAPTSPAP
jgi:plastocyanin